MDGIEVAQREGASAHDRLLLVVGATNRPALIDSALLRPGRFDKLIYVPPPSLDAALEIFNIHLRGTPLHASARVEELARAAVAKGLTGAEIEGLCREAATSALRESLSADAVHARHFDAALADATSSSTAEELEQYRRFERGAAR